LPASAAKLAKEALPNGALHALTLARLQFAFNHFISHHLSRLLPLACQLSCGARRALADHGRAVFLAVFNYWKKIFAISFGMGVVSGIVMSYQFGTNWSVFSDKTGPVLGPLMGYEVLTAFFPRGGLPRRHAVRHGARRARAAFFATLMVAVGTFISAFWILAVNSWMQTPARLRHERRWPVHPDRLVGGGLQPVVSLPSRAHGAGGLSHHRLRGRRGSAPSISCATAATSPRA
jgi:hypothetical protein